ncbi:12354_t:CDS:2 [Entrophospora sp. SA101]|nr:12354_t:CDS:2 [Entrophospora sp. SA101]
MSSSTNNAESVKENQLFYYFGEGYLTGVPTRNEIIAGNDDGFTTILKQALAKREDILCMPVAIEESNEYINNIAHYVLRLYGSLINGQKAVVTITGIKVFFDIRVPENKNNDIFESEIKKYLLVEKTMMVIL